jgi:hypothetical protein
MTVTAMSVVLHSVVSISVSVRHAQNDIYKLETYCRPGYISNEIHANCARICAVLSVK